VAKIHSDEIMLIALPDHPLAQKDSVSCQDLAGWPLILPKTGNTRSRLDAWLELVEDFIHISMELDSTEMIKRFVIAGLGVSFMAASHCREEVDSGRLAAVSLAPEPMIRHVGLIYRKDKALSRAALGFIDSVLEHAACGVVSR
jgi:DNA-binding transcriptional LysR family regulator